MNLNIAIPGLLWHNTYDIQSLYAEIPMQEFNQLIKKTNTHKHQFSYSDFIYHSLAKHNYDLSLANSVALSMKLDKLHTDFLIVEPTHLRVDRDRLLICESDLLQLDTDEEQLIINQINNYFTDIIKIYLVQNNCWLIGLNFKLNRQNNKFYPLIDIIGNNIDEYLPRGDNSILYTKLLNEIQMILFNLQLNNIRKTEGLLPVNSVWMWDKIPNDIYLTSKYSQMTISNDLNKLFRGEKNNLYFVDSLYYPNCYEDSSQFISIFEKINKQIISELQQMFYHGKIKQLNLLIPSKDQTIELVLNKVNKLMFWKSNTLQKIIKDTQ